MDIFDFAMTMEKDGEDYYRSLAAKAGNLGIKHILTMLADEEVKHFTIFRKMKEKLIVEAPDTALLDNVKNIFAEMKAAKEMPLDTVSEVALYKKALDLEKKSRDFYFEKAAEEQDESRKGIFLKLSNEEKRHYQIIESIIDFISQPDRWLEDAEVYHLKDY